MYDENGTVVESLATTVDEKGQFTLSFPADGTYTVEVSGICGYTCSGYGGGIGMTYKDATVVPTRCTVLVGKPKGKLGDLNGDGKVTNADVSALLDKVTAGEKVDLAVGDLNGDGKITNADVSRLLDLVTAGEI